MADQNMELKKYNSSISSKQSLSFFIKSFQRNGSKEISEKNLMMIFSRIKKNSKKDPLYVFKQFIDKCKPFCEIKSIRFSGINYKIPSEINYKRQKLLIYKWLIDNSLKRINYHNYISLTDEIIDTCNFMSKTSKFSEEFHKMAESNKIYIKFKN